jgi:hypothetical protein
MLARSMASWNHISMFIESNHIIGLILAATIAACVLHRITQSV